MLGGLVRSGGALLLGTGRAGLGAAGSVAGRSMSAAAGAAAGASRAAVRPLRGVLPQLAAVVDPRAERHRRVVTAGLGRAVIEVRGLAGAAVPGLAAALSAQLAQTAGASWWQLNGVTGWVAVSFDPGQLTAADLVAVVERVEAAAGASGRGFDQHQPVPGDTTPLATAAVALTADLVALGLATTAAVSRLPGPVAGPVGVARAAVGLVDAQPRARKLVEDYLGSSRTDLVITTVNAGLGALAGGPGPLLVDSGQRALALAEQATRLRSWYRWEPVLHRPGGVRNIPPVPQPARPVPLPAGPVERTADQATAGSLLAGALALAGRRGLSGAAEAALTGVPRAARTSREGFASTLSIVLGARGILVLDPAVWRRLDRITAVVIDPAVLLGHRRLILDATSAASGWPASHVWSSAQRLLAGPADAAANDAAGELPIPPPRGRQRARLRLRPAGGAPAAGSAASWHDLYDGKQRVGRVLIGVELDEHADGLLAAARTGGLRVVLGADANAGPLRSRADQVVAGTASLAGAVRALQADGHAVGVISRADTAALAAADLGVAVTAPTAGNEPPAGEAVGNTGAWAADLLVPDLGAAGLLLAAVEPARQVSARARTLSLSASTLGVLLLVARPTPGRWLRAGSPITAAAAAGLLNGATSGLRAGLAPPPVAVPLVPWHALETDDVLRRLPEPVPLAPAAGATGSLISPARLAGQLVRFAGLAAALPGPLSNPAMALIELSRYLSQELADPLTPVLSVGAAASAILGAPTDAILVGSVLTVNALVSAAQRQRADRALRGLLLGEQPAARLLTDPGARRTGPGQPAGSTERNVPAPTLRPGQVIAVRAGDVVPADARLIEAHQLELDESGLTGESVTVDKQTAATPGATLGEQACMLFQGSTVVTGSGRAVVVATGAATQAGRAVAAAGPAPSTGGVQAQLTALTAKALPLTLAGGAAVTALGALRGQPLVAALADGVAVAVAAVPEGLPLVATVSQLAAARRLSRRGVLVRSSRTVEALGRVDTVCFDKTGTLTEGQLRLVALADLDQSWQPRDSEASADARRLLRAAARACPDPDTGPVVHATDRAVLAAAHTQLGQRAAHTWDPVEEIPFESNRGYAATLGHTSSTVRLVVKGAPEVLLPRCTGALRADGSDRQRHRLDQPGRDRAEQAVRAMAEQGLRVLLVARRDLAEDPDDVEAAIEQLTLIGFIGLADAPRPHTPLVIGELLDAGISVRMITGDHPLTARAIAAQLGIPSEQVALGTELAELDEQARREVIARTTVFARVAPEQKVQIVQALQHSGRVVAMTGDGSNDAAAIRRADVGIGIGAAGSAAARDAADLVLTSPDLALLLEALTEGRTMWQRVRDAVAVLVGGNAGEVAFTLLGTALTGRAPVRTRQFLLVNLLTDMFPAMAIALAQPDTPPAEPAAGTGSTGASIQAAGARLAAVPRPELGTELLTSIGIRGAATAAGATGAWLTGRFTGPTGRAGTMGLVALVGTQLGQTLLTGWRSPLVWATTLGSGAVLIGIVQTPGVSHFFGCTPLDPFAWAAVAGWAAGATATAALAPRLLPALPPLSIPPAPARR